MVYKIKKFVNFLILFSYIQKQTFNQPLFYMIIFLPCFNIINAFKAAYLISGSILIILNDGVFEMDLNNPVLTGKKLRGAKKMARIPIKVVPTETIPKKPEWIRTKISRPEEV